MWKLIIKNNKNGNLDEDWLGRLNFQVLGIPSKISSPLPNNRRIGTDVEARVLILIVVNVQVSW